MLKEKVQLGLRPVRSKRPLKRAAEAQARFKGSSTGERELEDSVQAADVLLRQEPDEEEDEEEEDDGYPEKFDCKKASRWRMVSSPPSIAERVIGACCRSIHHRHRTQVSFTAVLGMDVLQHRLSGQCPLVPNVPVGVLHALCVSARKADEDRTLIVPTDAVHNKSVQDVFWR